MCPSLVYIYPLISHPCSTIVAVLSYLIYHYLTCSVIVLSFYDESPSVFIELPLNAKPQTYGTNLFENNAGVCA